MPLVVVIKSQQYEVGFFLGIGFIEPFAPEPKVANQLAKDKSQTQRHEEYGERED